MHFVYVIHSQKLDRFYIGETHQVEQRLTYHNDTELNTNSTKVGIPWEIFFILKAPNRSIARKVEEHIKRMKSKTYIRNLKKYSEMRTKLILKYD